MVGILVVIMMDRHLVRFSVRIVFVIVDAWIDCLKHVMFRLLYIVRLIMVNRLNEHGLVLCFRIDVKISLIVHWLDKMHLLMTDGVRVVVLHWLYDINEVDLRTFPVLSLTSFVLSLWNVMMIRSPVVLGRMFLFWTLGCRVDPEMFVKMMGWSDLFVRDVVTTTIFLAFSTVIVVDPVDTFTPMKVLNLFFTTPM